MLRSTYERYRREREEEKAIALAATTARRDAEISRTLDEHAKHLAVINGSQEKMATALTNNGVVLVRIEEKLTATIAEVHDRKQAGRLARQYHLQLIGILVTFGSLLYGSLAAAHVI